jgi:hypothetical protein
LLKAPPSAGAGEAAQVPTQRLSCGISCLPGLLS